MGTATTTLNFPRRYCLGAMGTVLVILVALFVAPDDPYSRYKALATTDYIKAGWIYERLNFDPTPVDIAFIGSSRTMQGIDSAAIERNLNDGSTVKLHVVNLGLPSLGRDVPYLIVRMLTETKRPSVIVVETDYIDYRQINPVFSQLAGADDVLGEPMLFNPGVVADLFAVSVRHAHFRLETLVHGPSWFDPSRYVGPHWDDVYETTGRDGRKSPPRLWSPDKAVYEADAADRTRNILHKASEYDRWAWAELNYNETYFHRLLDLAKASGSRIVLFYSTSAGAPDRPFHADALKDYGEMWSVPPDLVADNSLWVNCTHFNYFGAEKFSAWLAGRLRSFVDAAAQTGPPAAK